VKACLHHDFETRSKVDLVREGLDRYARDPSTRVLMLQYALDEHDVHAWYPHLGPMPPKLRAILDDPEVTLHAFNAEFERMIFLHVLKIDIPLERIVCTQAMAATLSLPLDLARVTDDALRLPREYRKDPAGDRLISLFCQPNRVTKKRPWEWNDWTTHPEDWEKFCTYGRQDVVAERKAESIFRKYLTPADIDEMRRLWVMCQVINERGVPVDLEVVRGAQLVAAQTKAVLLEKMVAISGLANPNSPDQVLPWVTERGYGYGNLRKERVANALDEQLPMRANLTPECIAFLELRQQAAKTSVTKLDAIMRVVSADGRLRHMFQFRGANRTGRYGGRTVQLQNLARPHKEVAKFLAEAREILRDADYEMCAMIFSSPLDVVSSSIRSCLVAEEGKKLVVADLAAIELAVLAWLTGCKFWLDVLRKKLDPYKSFGVHFLHKAYEELTKQERTDSKPGALGSGYRLGGGFLREDKNGDLVKTGLWGYAESLGVKLTQKQAAESVRVYRELSPEVVNFWYALEGAIMSCMRDPEHKPIKLHSLVIDVKAPFLRIRLPSGRRLHYLRPKIQKARVVSGRDEDGNPITFDTLNVTYEGMDQTTKRWCRISSHGGKFTENIVQAIALDVLNSGMEVAEARGFYTILHVHDEIGTMVEEDDEAHCLAKLIECMVHKSAPWMEGIPLSAAGYESAFYRKD
jgi:DNA polymerase